MCYAAMCKDEKQHRSRRAAKGAAKRARHRAKAQGDPTANTIAAYWCPYCNGYHIGHSTRRR